MITYRIDRSGGLAGVVTGALLAVAGPAGAGVSVIGTLTLQSTTQLVTTGSTSMYSTEYVLPTSGVLHVTLTDNLVLSPLNQLDFSLFKGGGSTASLVVSPKSAAGTTYVWDFDVTAGNYSTMFQAASGAIRGASGFWLGQFSDTVTFTPSSPAPAVPLPPAGGALLAGLGLLGVISRRGSRARPGTAPGAEGDGPVRGADVS